MLRNNGGEDEEEKHEGFRTKKSLGQHFLTDPAIAERIALEGNIKKGEKVLEIGPGTGNLTTHLLAQGATVIAVEPDERAVEALTLRFAVEVAEQRLIIRQGDIRDLSFQDLGLVGGRFKIIANIPYYISGLLFRLALGGSVKPSRVVFLVQKEVAERITRSEKESLLSLSVKAYGTPRYAFTVRRGSFAPQPKVDSAVIVVDGVSSDRLKGLSESRFFEFLHLGFGSRRKQLAGLLKQTYGESAVRDAFAALSIPEEARGEDLGIEQWIALARQIEISAGLSTRNPEK